MKIGLQTWGSHGDIRPFIALAEGLNKAGHDVTLVITCVDSDRYTALNSKKGLNVILVSTPVLSDKKEGSIFLQKIASTKGLPQLDILYKYLFKPVENEIFEASKKLCQDNDLVISHYFVHTLRIASQLYSKPLINVILTPTGLSSSTYPPPGMSDIGPLGNQILWIIARKLLTIFLSKYLNPIKESNNLGKTKDFFKEAWSSDSLNVVAVSNAICNHPDDWPKNVKTIGYLDSPNINVEGELPPNIDIFLNSGSVPFYFTLGSMMPPDIESNKKIIKFFLDAVKLSKARAIIQAEFWKECDFESDDNILFLKKAPHRLVFPKCCAVIHHGGAGTSHTATSLAVPSIILFYLSEQESWAIQLKKVGVSPGYLPFKKFTPKKLSKILNKVINNSEYKLTANLVSQKMQNENGVQNLIDLINSEYV